MSASKRPSWRRQVLASFATIVGGLVLGAAIVVLTSVFGNTPPTGAGPYLALGVGLTVPAFLVYFAVRVLVMLVRTRRPDE